MDVRKEGTMHTFSLVDDGTMDTVIACDDCGQEMRYNFDGDHGEDCTPIANGDCDCYGRFVDWAIEESADCHYCGSEKEDN